MFQIEEAQRRLATETDVAELLNEFAAVERFYREAIAAMSVPGHEVPPARSSADVQISFDLSPSSGSWNDIELGA